MNADTGDCAYALACFMFFACIGSVVCITIGAVNAANQTGNDAVSFALIGVGVAAFICTLVTSAFCLFKALFDIGRK